VNYHVVVWIPHTKQFVMAAMSSVVGAVDTASGPSSVAVSARWDLNWDEEDKEQKQQSRQEKNKLRKTRAPTSSLPSAPSVGVAENWDEDDVAENWDDEDVEELVAKSKVKTVKPVYPAPTALAAPPASAPLAPQAPLAAPAPTQQVSKDKRSMKRYTGQVRWFRGSFGWVTSEDVKTGRSIDSQGITNAIYLHKNDCHSSLWSQEPVSRFLVRPGMDVTFRVEPDSKGALKCVDVRCQEEQRLDMDSYKEMMKAKQNRCAQIKANWTDQVADSKANPVLASGSSEEQQKAKAQAATSRFSRSSAKFEQEERQKTRLQEPICSEKASGARLSRSNVEFHDLESDASVVKFHDPRAMWSSNGCSSTAAGSTSCSVSVVDVASESGVQGRLSVLETETKLDTETKWLGRSKYMTDSVDNKRTDNPRGAIASIAAISRYVYVKETQLGQLAEDEVPDPFSAADSWEDEGVEDALNRLLDGKQTNPKAAASVDDDVKKNQLQMEQQEAPDSLSLLPDRRESVEANYQALVFERRRLASLWVPWCQDRLLQREGCIVARESRRPSDAGSVASKSAASMISQCWSVSTAAALTLSKDEEMEARKLDAQLRRIDSLKERKASLPKGQFLTSLEESEIRRKPEIYYAPVMVKVQKGAARWTLDTEPLSKHEEKQVRSAEERLRAIKSLHDRKARGEWLERWEMAELSCKSAIESSPLMLRVREGAPRCALD